MSKLKENILLKLIFPLADKLMGLCATKWYKKINIMSEWSGERIEEWQNEELKKFIQHAYDNTVYYKRVFDELGLKPEDIKSKSDLHKLPIINKEIVAKHYDDIVPKNISNIRHRKSRTGGTTGEPMRYLCDENTWGYVTAAKIFNWKKTGYHYGDKFLVLGSASLFSNKPSFVRRIYDKMRSEIAMNGMNLSKEICEKYIVIIKKSNVKFIYGYAASVYLLAKYINDNNIKFDFISAFTTSEKLTDEYRKEIEIAFNCNVMDCYGAKDAGITAFESEKEVYPISYNSIAEIINPIAKNSGTLITTNILNYAFPLIRYEFGDEAVLVDNYNNYNGQVLLGITGRTSDVMRLSNGRNITGPGFTVLMKPFNIEAYQIKQIEDLAIEIYIKPNEEYTDAEEIKMKDAIVNLVGKDCNLKLIYVDEFLPEKNGKRRYFIN